MKIHCTNPDHDDRNESMQVYDDGGFCFACGYLDRSQSDTNAPVREKEDIGAKIEYITSQPRVQIRGLTLHSDSHGYYILWPERNFYKKRLIGGTPSRYLGPSGIRPPLFKIHGDGKAMAIVEGEINALSLAAGEFKGCIVSPGSASNMINFLQEYLNMSYSCAIVNIIVDKDAAGVAAGIELKRELLKKGKRVQLIACEKDLNQLLQDEGKEGVRKWVEENLEMQKGLYFYKPALSTS